MRFWLAKKKFEIQQQETMESAVERDLKDSNLRYEIKNAKGQWEQVPVDYFDTPAAKGE